MFRTTLNTGVSLNATARTPSHKPVSCTIRQVLKGLVEGLKIREIADLLHISPRTVEKHRAAVHAKLGTHSPTRLLTLAERLGLVGA